MDRVFCLLFIYLFFVVVVRPASRRLCVCVCRVIGTGRNRVRRKRRTFRIDRNEGAKRTENGRKRPNLLLLLLVVVETGALFNNS